MSRPLPSPRDGAFFLSPPQRSTIIAMRRLVWVNLLALVACPTLPTAHAQDLKQLERELKTAYEGKVVTLRNFYEGAALRLDAEGKALDNERVGPWTLYAKIEVIDIGIHGKKLEFYGNRIFMAYQKEKDWVHMRGPKMTLQIEYPSDQQLQDQIRASLPRVFLAPGESLADAAPVYWRRFLLDLEPKRVQPTPAGPNLSGDRPETQPAVPPAKRIRVSSGVLEARAIKKVAPRYVEIARNARVQGEVRLEAVIGTDGKIKGITIVEPLGMGLDDAAIEAVSQWEYEPTRLLGGEPVEVVTYISVIFKLR